jgi:hypothetical protein
MLTEQKKIHEEMRSMPLPSVTVPAWFFPPPSKDVRNLPERKGISASRNGTILPTSFGVPATNSSNYRAKEKEGFFREYK